MTAIAHVHGRQILDSRGNPTVEVEFALASGAFGRAAVPSGASTGEHEAVELRDGDPAVYLGKGVLEGGRQRQRRDRRGVVGPRRRRPARARRGSRSSSTARRRRAGSARTPSSAARSPPRRPLRPQSRPPALSLARRRRRAHAAGAADERDQRRRPRPEPARPAGVHDRPGRRGDVLRGAAHGHGGLPHLKAVLHERGLATGVGDEGGFAPDLESTEQAIEAILEAAERAGHRDRVGIALDPAASEIFRDGATSFRAKDARSTPAAMIDFYAALAERYPARLDRGRPRRERLGRLACADRRSSAGRVQLVGDDLFVTNVRVPPARDRRRASANAILVKVNQIGTLTEALDDDRGRAGGRLRDGHLAPLGRDGGHDDRRPRGGGERGPDQDRGAVAHRPRREVQPAPADRGGARVAKPCTRAGPPSGAPLACADAWPHSTAGRRSSPRSAPRRPAKTDLAALIEAGMDGARLNFSHGTHADHGRSAQPRAGRVRARSAGRSR